MQKRFVAPLIAVVFLIGGCVFLLTHQRDQFRDNEVRLASHLAGAEVSRQVRRAVEEAHRMANGAVLSRSAKVDAPGLEETIAGVNELLEKSRSDWAAKARVVHAQDPERVRIVHDALGRYHLAVVQTLNLLSLDVARATGLMIRAERVLFEEVKPMLDGLGREAPSALIDRFARPAREARSREWVLFGVVVLLVLVVFSPGISPAIGRLIRVFPLEPLRLVHRSHDRAPSTIGRPEANTSIAKTCAVLPQRQCLEAVPQCEHHARLERVVHEQAATLERSKNALRCEAAARSEMEFTLEQVRDQAQEAARAKSDFVANMGHEFRTPLNGVLGMMQLLDAMPLDEEARSYVRVATASGQSLLSHIDTVLEYSSLETGNLDIRQGAFSLVDVVDATLDAFAERAMSKRLELNAVLDVPSSALDVLGDQTRITQALTHLVSNAVKFTETGSVTLSVQGPGRDHGYLFEVVDSGIGISTEAQARMFNPFEQADASTTRKFGGVGLGLAVSRKLVAGLGGELSMASLPGEGSTLRFTIPLPPGRERAQASIGAQGCQGMRVVLVDRDKASVRAIEATMRLLGCEVHVVRTWAAAAEVDAEAGIFVHRAPGEAAYVTPPSRLDVSASTIRWLGLFSNGDRPPGSLGYAQTVNRPCGVRSLQHAVARTLGRSRHDGASERVSPALLRGHVLVAEDVVTNQLVTEAMLSQIGITADVVSNGALALAAVQARAYDAVLMDCHMPELNGYDATRAIRALEGKVRGVPIIALTANAMSDEKGRCLSSGMDDYLSKPLNQNELGTALGRYLAEGVAPALPDRDYELKELDGFRDSMTENEVPELVCVYRSDWGCALTELCCALEELNAETALAAARRLLVTGASVGNAMLVSESVAIERQLRAGEIDRAREGIGSLCEACEACEQFSTTPSTCPTAA